MSDERSVMHLIDPVAVARTLCGLEADTKNRRTGAMCQFLGCAVIGCATCRQILRELVSISLGVSVETIGGGS